MKRPIFLSRSSLTANNVSFLLQMCLKAKALGAGKQVHAWLVTTGSNLSILSLNERLVGVYASCGDVKSASRVFERIENPNVFAINWMILVSTFSGDHEKAVKYFYLMRESIQLCNEFTFSNVLKACVGLLDLNKGKEVHALVKQLEFENEVCVGNALIDMYSKCGSITYARNVFDRMVKRDIASWTSMICGYCNRGKTEEAIILFEKMKLEGLEPNNFTWSTMITGYARRGDSDKAFALLSTMTREGLVPDLVTWNAIISGFVQGRRAGEAFILFSKMLTAGIKPNLVTLTGLIPACSMVGSIRRGRELHGLMYRLGFDCNVFSASALIDMYSKCGSVKDAATVFEKAREIDVASWNGMISCYGKHGMVESSLQLFERMLVEGVKANEVTLASILSACSHSGYVDKGMEIFRSMKDVYGIDSNREHYSCAVDMLCRSGRMMEAYELTKGMPVEVSESIAGAFFNGCMIYGRKDLAKKMANDILRGNFTSPAGLTTLSNIFAASGEWKEVQNIRNEMRKKKFLKKSGVSLVDKREGNKHDDEAGLYDISTLVPRPVLFG